MSARSKLIVVESKLMLRDPIALFFIMVLPVMLLAIFNFITDEQAADAASRASLKIFVPAISMSLALTLVALNLLPGNLATYREKGILRRMSASPVHPSNVLTAQLLINFAVTVAATVLVIIIGKFGFDLDPPRHVLAFVVTFLLSVFSLFGIGLLVAALVPNSKAATAAGLSLLFPSLFFGGAFVPLEDMPETVATIGEYTPLGAAMTSFREAWAGSWPDATHLIVLAAIGLFFTLVAARVFRWE
ncbi:ABC transporter permease [Actinophytocola sediminis]